MTYLTHGFTLLVMITNKDSCRDTKQKDIVRRLVLEELDHPTAEEVYIAARREMPKISLGTVYRNLERLRSNGDVIEVKLDDVPTIYDKTTRDHAHFVCKHCKKVKDIEINIDFKKMDGSQIISVNSYVVGICPNCVDK